jgi:hypothetical protein
MEMLVFALLAGAGIHLINKGEQAQRIALLGRHLGQYNVEKLMEQVTEGYIRALDTPDAERRQQIWATLTGAEQELSSQFARFVADFAGVYGEHAQVSRLPVAMPRSTKLFPRACFDMRKVLAVHAKGIANVVANAKGLSPRDKAFALTAELYLMQHSCHWFCKSKNVASARLLARHKTSYAQVLEAVTPATRDAYERVVGGEA